VPVFLIQINPQILRWEQFHITANLLMVKAECKEWIQQFEFVGLVVETGPNLISK